MPQSVHGERLAFLDCLFTAVSAVCVTGLTVVDTGARFSGAGQTILLILIQLGGLGIMTLSTVVMLSFGDRLSFRARTIIHDTISRSRDRSLAEYVRAVVRLTLVAEAAGAVGLTLLFAWRYGETWKEAMSHGVFLAVSAFCNAGFSPYSDSLAGFAGDWWVLGLIMALIVAGGLGFVVILNMGTALFGDTLGQRQPLALHTRLVLGTTIALLVGATLAFLLLEWQRGLAGLPPGGRLLAALFQAVTTRTAGFNTLDAWSWGLASVVVTMFLMLVGAAPGSTGGGVKVSTLALLWASAHARYRGRVHTEVWNRTVPEATVRRALTTAAAGVVAIAVLLVVFLAVEAPPTGADHTKFLPQLFEVVSALGTVGLSMGATGELSAAGKCVLIVAMFLGRLGPLSLALAVSMEPRSSTVKLAEEDVLVG